MEVEITSKKIDLDRATVIATPKSIKWLFLAVTIFYGLYVFHGLMFKDGMDYVHGDFGDSRLVALFLENSYKYFSTLGEGTSFWSPSWIYFPFRNGMAFADNLIGALWLYAPWRILGLSEMTSYQLWFIGSSIANCAAFILLGRELKFSLLGLCAGCYLVAFGMPNIAYSNHPQLLSNYYVSLTLLFACRSLKAKLFKSSIKNAATAGLFYAMQCWTGFYQFWFFSFSAGFLVLVFIPISWPAFITEFKTHVYRGIVFCSVACILIFPLARRYLIVKAFAGERMWSEVEMYLPTWQSLLLPVGSSRVYQDLLYNRFSGNFPFPSELCMFAGFFALATPILFFFSLWKSRKIGCEKLIAAMAITIPVLLILTLKWENVTYWQTIYTFVPGATAVRAVGRISLLVLLYSSLLLAYIVTTLENRRTLWSTTLAVLIIFLVVIENSASHSYAFKKSEHAQRIDTYVKEIDKQKPCDVFHIGFRGTYDPIKEVDAMWTSMITGIPTSNGYSGVVPPKYLEHEVFKATSIDKLQLWFHVSNRNIPNEHICLIP